MGNQSRPHRQYQSGGSLTRCAQQSDSVAKLVGVLEVHGRDAADSFRVNVRRRDLLAECQSGKNGQFGARIVAVQVGAWIGLGITQLLRFLEHRIERGAALFYFCKDKIAGAVQDAVERGDTVARNPFA